MAFLDTSGLLISVICPSYRIHSHGTGNSVTRHRGPCGITLLETSLQREGETLLFSVFMQRLFVVHPMFWESRGPCPRPGETAPGVSQERGACGREILMAEGNTPSSGGARSALPAWKGCACAGAEPGSPGAAGRFPFFALGSLYIPGFIHTLQNKLPRVTPPSSLDSLPPMGL